MVTRRPASGSAFGVQLRHPARMRGALLARERPPLWVAIAQSLLSRGPRFDSLEGAHAPCQRGALLARGRPPLLGCDRAEFSEPWAALRLTRGSTRALPMESYFG